MDSDRAMEIVNQIGKNYTRGEVTSTDFLNTVAGVIVTLGRGPRNNVLLQLRFILMSESLPRRVEDFVNDLCNKLGEMLAGEAEAEEYKIKEALENARKAYYDALTEQYKSETASLTAEVSKKKAEKELKDMDSRCLLL
ncbi:MAG: hypothetical protein LBB26_01065 [Puniceicoccales bacterium]|nr:hypothetical protein [Puniceicoccales bacterium]